MLIDWRWLELRLKFFIDFKSVQNKELQKRYVEEEADIEPFPNAGDVDGIHSAFL